MLIDAPRNSATDVNRIAGTSLNSRGYRNSASNVPMRNGVMMLAWLMTTAACPRLRMSFGSNSNPIRNRKKITPTWLRAFRY